MRMRKIEKEILEQLFPNEKIKFMKATPDNILRGFSNEKDDLALFICDNSVPKEYIDVFTQLMVTVKHFNVVITHYKDKILVIMTKKREALTPNI